MSKTAKDYIFATDASNNDDDGGATFTIVSFEYWKEKGFLSDGEEDGEVEELIPDGFENLMEATWDYYDSDTEDCNKALEDGKKALIAAGFVHSEELQKFIDGNLSEDETEE